jgi:hypothetical protein
MERASRVRRFQIATAGIAVVILTTTLIASAVPAGASPAKPAPGEVLCQTLSPGSGNDYVFGRCSDKAETGGSGSFNFGRLISSSQEDVRIRWATGKVTVFKDTVQEEIGACPPGGPTYDSWQIQGGIVKDTTGKISAPVYMNLCGPGGGWQLEGAAQI